MSSRNVSERNYTLITGATSTLGSAIARRRASLSEPLCLHGRNIVELKKLAAELSQHTDVIVWERDLARVEYVYDEFKEFIGSNRISIGKVVHAAALIKILPLRMFQFDDTLSIYNVNVFSIIEILRVLTNKNNRELLKSVVFLSAFFSKFGDRGNAIYSSSKGALNSLIKGLAVEYPQTRFNALLLGAVRTKMTEHLFHEENDRFDRYILGTGNPHQVVNAVDFLLGSELWMTGQEVYLDGGASAS